MQIRKPLMEVVAALFGKTPSGFVGTGLQWLTIAIVMVLVLVGPSLPLAWCLALTSLGIVAMFAGLVFAVRGKSMGPIIFIPGVVGIALIILLASIVYPLTLLTNDKGIEGTHSTRKR